MNRLTAARVRGWLPRWKKNINKGDRGRILIVAGSRGMIGAATLCSWGAVRSGAGLVRLATVKSQQPVAAKRAPLEAMTEAWPEDRAGHLSRQSLRSLNRALKSFRPDVAAAGPGLGRTPSLKILVLRLLDSVPLVLDADGLNAFAGRGLPQKHFPLIITPHPGELSRLIGWSVLRIEAAREQAARFAARRFRCVCLLKGAGTIVTDGREAWMNTTGNPGMASGGMGDVLTGIIAGIWAQFGDKGISALRAACLGAFLHGRAGDIGARRTSARSLVASDLAGFLSSAFSTIEGN
jgi:NAD(P)H-hydrate epimerase